MSFSIDINNRSFIMTSYIWFYTNGCRAHTWRPRNLQAWNLIITSLGQPLPQVPRDLLQPARIDGVEVDTRMFPPPPSLYRPTLPLFSVYHLMYRFYGICVPVQSYLCWRAHLACGDHIVPCGLCMSNNSIHR